MDDTWQAWRWRWRLVTLLGLCARIVTSAPTQCLSQSDEICYQVNDVKLTWRAADDACAQQGGRLLTLSTQERQQTLRDLMTSLKLTNVWVGGQVESHETPVWRWISKCSDCGTNIDEEGHSSISPQGCYDEYFANRDFSVQLSVDDVTPRRCIDACAGHRYAYAALQDGSKCFCGNSFGKHGAQGGCTVRCVGDSSQTCGGWGVNYVLKVNGLYGSWSYDQPNNNDEFENCGALYHSEEYKFADKNCKDKFRFLCNLPSCPSQLPTSGQYQMVSGRCVYVSLNSNRLSWFSARKYCLKHGGDLATVYSYSDHLSIGGWLSRRQSTERFTWVGLTKKVWHWTDGTDIKYGNFHPDEPTDVDNGCLYVDETNNGVWKTDQCDIKRAFACGIDLRTTTSTTTRQTTTTTTTRSTTRQPVVTTKTTTTTTKPTSATTTTATTTKTIQATLSPTTTTTTKLRTTTATHFTTAAISTTKGPLVNATTTPSGALTVSGTVMTSFADHVTTSAPVNASGALNTGQSQDGNTGSSMRTVYWVLLAIACFLFICIVVILIVILCFKCSNKKERAVSPDKKYDARPIARLPNDSPLPLAGDPNPYNGVDGSRSELIVDSDGWKTKKKKKTKNKKQMSDTPEKIAM